MAKWSLTGVVSAGKYLGEVEADTMEEAIQKGLDLDGYYISLCVHCSDQAENAEVTEIIAEKVED